jgi:hypothetical protein
MTGLTSMKLGYILRLAREVSGDDDMRYYIAKECAYLLAPVKRIDGDVDFSIPFESPTKESFKKFVDDLSSQNERVYLDWCDAVFDARKSTQDDTDLLPEHELTEDQKKAELSLASD